VEQDCILFIPRPTGDKPEPLSKRRSHSGALYPRSPGDHRWNNVCPRSPRATLIPDESLPPLPTK
jgi:hypothetical protein